MDAKKRTSKRILYKKTSQLQNSSLRIINFRQNVLINKLYNDNEILKIEHCIIFLNCTYYDIYYLKTLLAFSKATIRNQRKPVIKTLAAKHKLS